MTSKELFISDLDVIFNVDEHAETRTINGVEMPVIWDTDRFEEMGFESKSFQNPSGIYENTLTFAVKKSDYGDKPAVTEQIEIDDEFNYIVAVDEWSGMYYIKIERPDS